VSGRWLEVDRGQALMVRLRAAKTRDGWGRGTEWCRNVRLGTEYAAGPGRRIQLHREAACGNPLLAWR
jgi:hypothetical protein